MENEKVVPATVKEDIARLYRICDNIIDANTAMMNTTNLVDQRVDMVKEQVALMNQEVKEIKAWINVIDTRIAKFDERIDVYNKRVRMLEKKTKLNKGEIKSLWRSLNEKENAS